MPIAELEKRTILNAISELNGDKLQAARLLGIGKTTLYRKLKDYAGRDIETPRSIPGLEPRRAFPIGNCSVCPNH
jgi:DNA-binding NtrC family response regulator